jgi:hypothetical protein
MSSGTENSRPFTHGGGIYPMKTLTDKVCFEQSGSAVHMQQNCNGAPLAKRKSQ